MHRKELFQTNNDFVSFYVIAKIVFKIYTLNWIYYVDSCHYNTNASLGKPGTKAPHWDEWTPWMSPYGQLFSNSWQA